MKIFIQLTLAVAALSVAGCAHHERQAQYQNYPSSYYSSAGTTATTPAYTANQYTANQANQYSSADQPLVTRVQDTLKKDPSMASIAPRIEVSAQSGNVTLSGSVPNELDKQRIESMTKGTPGVVSVNNQIQVSLPPTSTSENSKLYQESKGPITGQASAAETEPSRTDTSDLSKPTAPTVTTTEPGIANANVSTNSLAGDNSPQTTAVSPTAPSTPTSQPGTPSRIYSTNQTFTTDTASQTTGNLDAKVQGTTGADRSLGQQVMQQLNTDATFAGQTSGIQLSVDNGKVTLRGNVSSEDQKKAIEAAVQKMSGVTSVENDIQVGAVPSSTSDLNQNK